ncbi:hypothetical protein CEXT_484361 [Caerostris extrusa]|uniref:Uncharacterized protein n=1 Tax=Caerostris extrusa TaxID=172846 RepID=A0AAV4Y7K1_CAEEX|nr:hypothetical protein CEXT_484361 [Caerostris extrusa]
MSSNVLLYISSMGCGVPAERTLVTFGRHHNFSSLHRRCIGKDFRQCEPYVPLQIGRRDSGVYTEITLMKLRLFWNPS